MKRTILTAIITLTAHGLLAQDADSDEQRLSSTVLDDDWLDSEALTGDWGGQRESLKERGLEPYLELAPQFLANADGGMDTGSAWEALVDLGLEADMEKLVGWTGGSFFVNAFYFHGNDLSADYVGDFNGVSNIYTDTDFNLFNLYVGQSLLDDKLFIKLGQIAADDDFMVADTSLLFVNSAFGPLSLESGNIAAPIYPLAAPGAFVSVEATENIRFQTAIYAGDAGPNQANNHGFKWRTGGSAGWAWFAETAVDYELLGSGVFKLGGYYATSEFTNFNTGVTERGLGAIYGVIDHQILKSHGGHPGLSVFLRGGASPDGDVATVTAYVDGGFALQSICFEDDALGIACSQTWFGDDYLNATRTGGTAVTSSETIIEATYSVALAQWCSLQPDLQYIINPHYSRDNALVLGARCAIVF